MQSALDKYPAVYQNGVGKMEGFKAKIHVQPDAKPKFCRARSVSYAMREKVEAELNRLLEGTSRGVGLGITNSSSDQE